jgi:hypothetical protein
MLARDYQQALIAESTLGTGNCITVQGTDKHACIDHKSVYIVAIHLVYIQDLRLHGALKYLQPVFIFQVSKLAVNCFCRSLFLHGYSFFTPPL